MTIAIGPLGKQIALDPGKPLPKSLQQRSGALLALGSSFVGWVPSNLALDAVDFAASSPNACCASPVVASLIEESSPSMCPACSVIDVLP